MLLVGCKIANDDSSKNRIQALIHLGTCILYFVTNSFLFPKDILPQTKYISSNILPNNEYTVDVYRYKTIESIGITL